MDSAVFVVAPRVTNDAHGRADRRALPNPNLDEPRREEVYVYWPTSGGTPATGAGRHRMTTTSSWGDSIQRILMAARANQPGRRLTPKRPVPAAADRRARGRGQTI